MAEIQISKGYCVIVDDEDFNFLSQWKWTACDVNRNGRFMYAARGEKKTIGSRKVQKRVYMHRQIAGATTGQVVDHINHNTLDNRKANLRLVSAGQNLANNTRAVGLSGYRGVTRKGPFWYAARAGRGGELVYYNTLRAAAHGYDAMATARWGDCARLNFPDLRPNGQEHATR